MIENFENMDIKGFTEVFFHQIEKAYQYGVNAGQNYDTAIVSETSSDITSESDSYDDREDERDTVSEPAKAYLGAYDCVAYGVYDSVSKHRNSLPYWKKTSYNDDIFDSYEEALEFARNGVSQLSGVPVNQMPPMEGRINFRNRIVKGGK
jgi:hypothetical protein